jgi:hypothetical protein
VAADVWCGDNLSLSEIIIIPQMRSGTKSQSLRTHEYLLDEQAAGSPEGSVLVFVGSQKN